MPHFGHLDDDDDSSGGSVGDCLDGSVRGDREAQHAYGRALAIVATLVIAMYVLHGFFSWRRWDNGYTRLRFVHWKRINALQLLPQAEPHLDFTHMRNPNDGRGAWRKVCPQWLRSSCASMTQACDEDEGCRLFPCVAIRRGDVWWVDLISTERRKQEDREQMQREHEAFLQIGCGDHDHAITSQRRTGSPCCSPCGAGGAWERAKCTVWDCASRATLMAVLLLAVVGLTVLTTLQDMQPVTGAH
uniref:Uncharacterized protein n=1 Tax=Prymnesium polylepis TaxID=72548 RepID=A0A7S4HDC7_9EUKA